MRNYSGQATEPIAILMLKFLLLSGSPMHSGICVMRCWQSGKSLAAGTQIG